MDESAGREAQPLMATNWAELKALYKHMVSKEAKKAQDAAKAAAAKQAKEAAAAARRAAASGAAASSAAKAAKAPTASSKPAAGQPTRATMKGSTRVEAAVEAKGSAAAAGDAPSTSGRGFAAAAPAPAGALPPGFKGFGAPPASAVKAAAVAATNPHALKVFRHAVDEDRVQQAIHANGWGERVVLVEQLQDADAIVTVKLTRGGKHISHDQVRCFVCIVQLQVQDEAGWQHCTDERAGGLSDIVPLAHAGAPHGYQCRHPTAGGGPPDDQRLARRRAQAAPAAEAGGCRRQEQPCQQPGAVKHTFHLFLVFTPVRWASFVLVYPAVTMRCLTRPHAGSWAPEFLTTQQGCSRATPAAHRHHMPQPPRLHCLLHRTPHLSPLHLASTPTAGWQPAGQSGCCSRCVGGLELARTLGCKPGTASAHLRAFERQSPHRECAILCGRGQHVLAWVNVHARQPAAVRHNFCKQLAVVLRASRGAAFTVCHSN